MIYFIFLASSASATCYLACHWRKGTEFPLRSWSFPFASSALWVRASTALHAKYVITDSWFTCEQLMACARSIGKGAMHFVGLSKTGKTRYTVSGRKKNVAELIAAYEREQGKSCRKYRCRYIQLNGNLGDIPVRIFLIKYGRNSAWNVLVSVG